MKEPYLWVLFVPDQLCAVNRVRCDDGGGRRSKVVFRTRRFHKANAQENRVKMTSSKQIQTPQITRFVLIWIQNFKIIYSDTKYNLSHELYCNAVVDP